VIDAQNPSRKPRGLVGQYAMSAATAEMTPCANPPTSLARAGSRLLSRAKRAVHVEGGSDLSKKPRLKVTLRRYLTSGAGMIDSKHHATLRLPLDLRAVSLVLLLCVVWGFQQVAIKGVAANAAPVLQLAIRFCAASLFFGVWVSLREGRRAFSDGTLPSGMLLGVLFSLEFVFAGQALVHTTAAHTVVFLYTAPIFTALGLQFLPQERLSAPQWAGIVVAFLGIVVAFFGFSGLPAAELLTGDGLALLGGVCWGLSNIVLRRGRIGSAATIKTVLYQVATAAVVLGGFAAVTGQTRVELSMMTLWSLLFQIAIVAILSYFVWFWLLGRYLTSRLMLLSLLTPLFGVLFGALILGDAVDTRFAIGAVLVLAGVLIVNRRLLLRAH
jgi:drug/metabolite transporter (DMT)-like permease